MVEFITLFLGLVAGIQPVEFVVGGEVVSVELRLDGQAVGLLQGEPWALNCDLGETLAPHELEAIGFDAGGNEIARAHQWVNLPRARTEARFVFEGASSASPRTVQLLWSSVDAVEPDSLRVRFDGELLEGATAERIELPPYDESQIHLLEAELQLGDVLTRTESVVGGVGDSLSPGLTAIPMRWTGGSLPAAAEMEGWLERRGEPLRIVAIDRGPGEVMMVQDLNPDLQRRLARLQERSLAGSARSSFRRPTGLKAEDRFRVLLPVPAVVSSETRSVQFPMSPDLWGEQKEVYSTGAANPQVPLPTARGILSGIPILVGMEADTSDQRLADAVASAGLAAAASSRPRVVVLITGPERSDKSRFSATAVRDYLQQLHVPFRVWSPQASGVDPSWGPVEDISSGSELFRAIRSLRSQLDEQVLVWVEGRHLPQEIRTGEAAPENLRLVAQRGSGPSPASAKLRSSEQALTEASGERSREPSMETTPAPPTIAATAPNSAASPAVEVLPAAESLPRETYSDDVEVRVVNIEVVATRRDGTRVRELRKQDFELLEDGKPVEISHFIAPNPARNRTQEGSAAPQDSFHLVVFLDLFHLQRAQLPRVLRALRAALPDQLGGIQTSLVSYDGGVRVDQGFTSDPAKILQTLEKLQEAPPSTKGHRAKGRALGEEGLAADFANIWGEFESARRISDSQVREVALAMARSQRDSAYNQLRSVAELRRHETRAVLRVLGQMVASLGSTGGRKALFYVGDRLALEPARALYEEGLQLLENDPGPPGGSGLAASQLESEMRSLNMKGDFDLLLEQANGNGVTLYSLTPLNLLGAAGVLPASAGKAGFQGRSLSLRDEMVKEAGCHLATETGGLCRAGASQLAPGVEEAFDDLDAVYSLGFSPNRPADGSFHRVRVKVRHPGIKVRHRQGYLDKAREDRVEDRLTSALLFDAQDNTLGAELRLESLRPSDDGKAMVLPLEVLLPTADLALLPTPDGQGREAKCRLLVVTLTEDGHSTAIQELPLVIRVTEQQLMAGRAPLYSRRIDLTLVPKAAKIAIGIWDEAGRQGAFLSRAVTDTSTPTPEAR
ncbi:MAG: VWA domain-containing protein [Deltaproteobacteria bacterium]|nr:VWA domain-containing protein [Deltaproteobacteria bacterium]